MTDLKKLQHFLIENYRLIEPLENNRVDTFSKAKKEREIIIENELEKIRNSKEGLEIKKLLKESDKILLQAKLKCAVIGGKIRPSNLLGTNQKIVLGDNNKELLRSNKIFDKLKLKKEKEIVADIIKMCK